METLISKSVINKSDIVMEPPKDGFIHVRRNKQWETIVTDENDKISFVPSNLLKEVDILRKLSIGRPVYHTSVTLPENHSWCDGSFISFSDYPEFKEKYESGGFIGMLLEWDSTQNEILNNPGNFRKDSEVPTGLYLPSNGAMFLRLWNETVTGVTAGSKNDAGLPNITGSMGNSSNDAECLVSAGGSDGSLKSDGAFKTVKSVATNLVGSGADVAFTGVIFDAASSNPIYGNSTEVMPNSVNQPVIIYLGRKSTDEAFGNQFETDILNGKTSTFIGEIKSIMANSTYVPNGCVPCDGSEHSELEFPTLWSKYLTGDSPKLLTCTYAEFDAQVALTGNCAKFALDTDNQKFKVPLLKDGDSITHAASASELGKSYKAGLPNSEFTVQVFGDGYVTPSGSITKAIDNTPVGIAGPAATGVRANLHHSLAMGSTVYGNSTTVTDEQVRLRHFVVLASAQNNQSVFDWSNYMAGLAGKANTDLSNLEPAANNVIKSALNATGDAPIFACRAWVNFNGQGTVAIRASGNVSSITDDGTGKYTVNFTTAMPDINYCTNLSGRIGAIANDVNFTICIRREANPLNINYVKISTGQNNATPDDAEFVCVSIFR